MQPIIGYYMLSVFFHNSIKKMTIDELKNRYLVIGKYPNSPFKIGEIILFKGSCYISQESNFTVCFPYDYPNIFKKLYWWENINVEKQIKSLKDLDGKILKPTSYQHEGVTVFDTNCFNNSRYIKYCDIIPVL